MSGDYDTPGWINDDYVTPTGALGSLSFVNFSNAQFSERDQDQYKGGASYFVDDLVGPHELKGGIEYRLLDYTGNNYAPGGEYYNVYVTGMTGRTDHRRRRLHRLPDDPQPARRRGAPPPRPATSGPTTFRTPGGRSPTSPSSPASAWTPPTTPTWTARRSPASPRSSPASAWRGTSSVRGKSVIRANWGTFMHPGSVNLAETVNGRSQGSLTFTGYEYYCIVPNHPRLCNREWLAENRALDGQEVVTIDAEGQEHYWYLTTQSGIDPFETVDTLGVGELEAAYVETLSVAFEQQLWDETSISVEYVDKKTESLIEDVCGNNDWIWDSSVPRRRLRRRLHLDRRRQLHRLRPRQPGRHAP